MLFLVKYLIFRSPLKPYKFEHSEHAKTFLGIHLKNDMVEGKNVISVGFFLKKLRKVKIFMFHSLQVPKARYPNQFKSYNISTDNMVTGN